LVGVQNCEGEGTKSSDVVVVVVIPSVHGFSTVPLTLAVLVHPVGGSIPPGHGIVVMLSDFPGFFLSHNTVKVGVVMVEFSGDRVISVSRGGPGSAKISFDDDLILVGVNSVPLNNGRSSNSIINAVSNSGCFGLLLYLVLLLGALVFINDE